VPSFASELSLTGCRSA